MDIINKAKNALTIENLIKYLIQGLVLCLVAYVIPNKRTKVNEIIIISALGALSLFILDIFADPNIAFGAKFGAGAGIGMNLVNSANAVIPFMV